MRGVAFAWRVFLPFSAGYYLSYLFRTVNAVIADRLEADFSLDATHLGLLTSVYFLTFAAVQLPLGAALDRYGPRRVQGALLAIAAGGAALFAEAASFPALVLSRALIGFGVAGGLMAGLKAIALWWPRERLALANGVFIAIGTAGAMTATTPVELLLASTDWHRLFQIAAALTAAIAVAILLLVPDHPHQGRRMSHPGEGLSTVFRDARFWRIAPLSVTCIGTAWAMQGLWAAPWLTDVAALQHAEVVRHLFIMATALCVGALAIGIAADRLRRFGISPRAMLTVMATTFIAAELALVLRVPISTSGLWAAIGVMGAATVLSYAILADCFSREIAGRANAALNVLHIGGAFGIQSLIGLIIGEWQGAAGAHYPPAAYATAFGSIIAVQAIAFCWFLRAPPRLAGGGQKPIGGRLRAALPSRMLGPDHELVLSQAKADRERARTQVLWFAITWPGSFWRRLHGLHRFPAAAPPLCPAPKPSSEGLETNRGDEQT